MGNYIEKEEFNLKKFLFGKIKKKLVFAFGVLILLLVTIVFITYSINQQIEQDQILLKEVEAPLELMNQQVIGYDSILTGIVHEALLHAEKGEFDKIEEYRANYDAIGIKLDNLLKFQARDLTNKSKRNSEDKKQVYEILDKLDKINVLLVDLEISAFDAMKKEDIEKARSLVLTTNYEEYKKELAELYTQWGIIEKKVSEEYRNKILNNSKNVKIYNLGLGLIFILIASFIPFIMTNSIAKPIKELASATEKMRNQDFKARVNIKSGDELEELGNSFNKTIEILENLDKEKLQIDKAKTEFLSITSHELRSPMTPMKAQLQMVLGDYFGKITKEQRDSLEIVLNNTERLDKIIVDFLEISRIEAARLKFNFVRANLAKTVETVVNEMKGFMPEKKIKIEMKLDKLPIIEVDPDRASQILRNLINNALKFSPENSKIEVSAKLQKGMILFSVKDEGVGIAEKDQRKLFEPFYQVENMYQHKSGGTGLGLAISKGIVESQNGKIWLNSQLGKGTIFYFTVPLKPVREMKAIKLLFSEIEKSDEELKKIFKEYIGPLGEKEFENLKDSKGITLISIREYIYDLIKKGILQKGKAEEFKNKVSFIFNKGGKEIKEEKMAEERAASFFKRGRK